MNTHDKSPPVTLALARDHGLSEQEYRDLVGHLGRTPTFEELGVFAVMWSEHCSYKSSRLHLAKLPTAGPAVLQGPGENAGAVDIGGGLAAVFKIESHNHPSYIEPFQGAATGVGGILRDVFTMGARPVASLNSLRFGSPENEKTAFLLRGVVAGIGGYGNSVGVPTVGGELYFDPGYNGNILVNAFTLGIAEQRALFRAIAAGPGNPVLYVGSKTGRDGIHGASLLASSEFKKESEQMKPTVQVGDPFTENLLIEACLEAMAGDDVVAIQDMGAAGLSSSSVEMAARGKVGIRLDLDRIPLREESLSAYEMLLSESQERMLLVASKRGAERLGEIFRRWGLDCVCVGEVTRERRFEATFHGKQVVSIPVEALTTSAPRYDRVACAPERATKVTMEDVSEPDNLEAVLLALLESPNLCSRKWIYEQYDFYVGADTVIAPGGDAAVLRVRQTGGALALTTDCNARYVWLDPYLGAQHAVAEAARNVAVTGARPLAVSDCLNFGNPEKPEVMWQFARAVEGLGVACKVFQTPVVSGNVSFYNDNRGDSIPPTPVVAMVGLIADVARTATSGFHKAAQTVYLLGDGVPELNGSEYLYRWHGATGHRPPLVDLAGEALVTSFCAEMIERGLLRTAHDVAEGGLAVALAEMCLNGSGVGCHVELRMDERADVGLFGESGRRVLIALAQETAPVVEQLAERVGVALTRLGLTGGDRLRIDSLTSVPAARTRSLIDLSLEKVKKSWEDTLGAVAAGGQGSAQE